MTSDLWRAELQFGANLFANWCDDVLEPGEPEPEVEERWEVSGTIEVIDLPEPGSCGPATAHLGGLEAEAPSGERLTLGDIEVKNGFWGCFAG